MASGGLWIPLYGETELHLYQGLKVRCISQYFCVQTPKAKVDPWGLITVFDMDTYILIVSSIVFVCLLFIFLTWLQGLVSHLFSTYFKTLSRANMTAQFFMWWPLFSR